MGRQKTLFQSTALLVWLCTLLFWGDSWEVEFGMDAMTYAGLARHILSTGDWLTLHYSGQAYSNFYQHPPLVMWMMAVVFHLTGQINEVAAKILPYIFGLGTLFLTVLWVWGDGVGCGGRSGDDGVRHSGRGKGGKGGDGVEHWAGFLSGFILITSTRYVKYGASPMLDGFLAFWFTLGGYSLIQLSSRPSRPILWGSLLGLSISLGFLTKGLPILALVGISCGVIVILLSRNPPQGLLFGFLASILCAALPLFFWVQFLGGKDYLHHYWFESVQGRLGAEEIRDLGAPLKSLFKGYWPWVPLYLVAVLDALRPSRLFFEKKLNLHRALAPLFSLAILGGFSLTGHFLEHYLVPFFPFAAITCASYLAEKTTRWEQGFYRGTELVLGLLTLLLALFPLHIQGKDYLDPTRRLVRQATEKCRAPVSRFYFASDETPFWGGLALGSWLSPWDTWVIDPTKIGQHETSVLLLTQNRSDLVGWEPTGLENGDFRIYQKSGSGICH
jgi:4-amino-4-deoxy-L-arabinose transferase-like glycosyltransferase